jgi:hypothetical protein
VAQAADLRCGHRCLPFEERSRATARQGGRLQTVLAGFVVALPRYTRNTERGVGQFLVRFAVRAALFALPRNTRNTERGVGRSWSVLRCAPHSLRFLPGAVQFFRIFLC